MALLGRARAADIQATRSVEAGRLCRRAVADMAVRAPSQLSELVPGVGCGCAAKGVAQCAATMA